MVRKTKKRSVARKIGFKRRNSGGAPLLSEAVSDVNKELKRLGVEKGRLVKQLEKTQSSMTIIQNKEGRLRDQITRLIAKENFLTKKKSSLDGKIGGLKEKLDKVRRIKDQLREL